MRRGIVLAAVVPALWAGLADAQEEVRQKHGFTKRVLPLEQIVDTSFLDAAARAVGE
jgi:hypothetical protein